MHCNSENSICAKYYIETKGNLAKVAETIASLETTGKWLAKTPPTELFAQCQGEVKSVEQTEAGKGFIEVYYPLINLNMDEAAFACLWLEMIGGATFALLDYEKSRLVDFELPEAALSCFPGPRFGMKGTRELLKMQDGDLVVGTIVKPTAGLTAREVADMCYQAAHAGVRFIKDDEKMMNVPYCSLAERVRLVTNALRRAEQETGRRVLYAPHITAGPNKIKQFAHIALENGANALMVNFFAAGFGSLEMLRCDPEINVPLYAHCGGREALGRIPDQGVSPVAVAKFARLCGGDYFRTGILDSYLVGTREEYLAMNEALQRPWGPIKDAVPVLSGGLNPMNLVTNLELFGLDVLALAGTGIFSHPIGPEAGVMAMHQAAAAFREHVPLGDYAKNHPELAALL